MSYKEVIFNSLFDLIFKLLSQICLTLFYVLCYIYIKVVVNPLSAKFIKWSNTLKQIVGKLPTICLGVFDHFSGLAFKGLRSQIVVFFQQNIQAHLFKVHFDFLFLSDSAIPSA